MGSFARLYLGVIAVLIGSSLTAQNHLYSTEQFGIDGAMLGGAVIAGADDVSMTFYNPAAIHKVSAQISISLIQPAIRTFGFNEFWGNDERSVPNTDVGIKPSLISFKKKFKKLELAFLKLNKSELTDAFSAKQDLLSNNFSTTQFFDYEYTGRDNWFGLGTNFKISPKVYLGLSQFLSIARFSYRNTILVEELDVSDNSLNRFFNSAFQGAYGNISSITKLGLLLDTDRHDLGVTITTPTYLRTGKSGELFRVISNVVDDDTQVNQQIDKDIAPLIKTPWEFNLGYSLELNERQKVWLNSSYHAGIEEYEMVSVVEDETRIPWMNGSKAVYNFALAYSQSINPVLQLSGGFRTNNFAYENRASGPATIRNTILDGNHIHAVLGSKMKFKGNTILLGIDYGRISNVPDEESFQRLSNLDVLAPSLGRIQKSNISILLTYGFIIDEIRHLNSD